MEYALTVFSSVALRATRCAVDGKQYEAHVGNWAFYIPALRVKFLHSIDGVLHCLHETAPDRRRLFAGDDIDISSTYVREDWEVAYRKSVIRRTAENIVSTQRLDRAGLGPKFHGPCIALQFNAEYAEAPTFTAGMIVENLKWKWPKRKTRSADLARAGVAPDRINSCTRHQIRGYVSDLDSVVGVMPVDAEDEICHWQNVLDRELMVRCQSLVGTGSYATHA